MNNYHSYLSPTVEDLMIYDRIFKKSLKCKCFALVFCTTGTAIMLLLPFDFLNSKILEITLPSFFTGYMLVNIAGILTACRGHIDLFADICFTTCGSIVNICCGMYLLYYWIDWITSTLPSGNVTEGALYLVLSASCFLNVAAMGIQLVLSILELRRRGVSFAGDDDR